MTCSARPVAARTSPRSRMANSSPSSRASVASGWRTQACRRRATSISSASPTSWPRLLLTSLKRSRSSRSTVQPRPALGGDPVQRLPRSHDQAGAAVQPGERVVVRLEQQPRLRPLPFADLLLEGPRVAPSLVQHLPLPLLQPPQIVHVGGRAEPLDDPAGGVADRQGARPVPQVGAVRMPPDPERGVELAVRPRLLPGGDCLRAVVRMQDVEPAAAVALRLGLAGEAEPLRAGPMPVAEVRRPPKQLRHALDEAAQPLRLPVRPQQAQMQLVQIVRSADPLGAAAGPGRQRRDGPMPAVGAVGAADAVLDAGAAGRRRRRPGLQAGPTVVRMDRVEPAEPEAGRIREPGIVVPARAGPAALARPVAGEDEVGQVRDQPVRNDLVLSVAQSKPLRAGSA